jgi:hypothetical protein
MRPNRTALYLKRIGLRGVGGLSAASLRAVID